MLKIKHIKIDNGDTFEGSLEQFQDCFFSNADLQSITAWCEEKKCKLEITFEVNKMNAYVALHHHKYGTSAYPFYAAEIPSEDKIIKFFDIDFEPDCDEYIEIDEIGEIPTLE